jgi:hypothetical protein
MLAAAVVEQDQALEVLVVQAAVELEEIAILLEVPAEQTQVAAVVEVGRQVEVLVDLPVAPVVLELLLLLIQHYNKYIKNHNG